MTAGFLLLALLLFVGAAYIRARARAAELIAASWDELVAQLHPVSVQVFLGDDPLEHPAAMAGVKELEEMKQIYRNATILIALANYAVRWNSELAHEAATCLRKDALELRRAVLRHSITSATSNQQLRRQDRLREASVVYQRMSDHIILLYDAVHVARVPLLREHLRD